MRPASPQPNPEPNDIAALVAAVADAQQQLHDVGAVIQERQEGVNKAIAEVQSARDQEAAAIHDVDARQRGVTDANAAIATAQANFDRFAAATYVNGPSASYLTASAARRTSLRRHLRGRR